jgi:hypothetical protein
MNTKAANLLEATRSRRKSVTLAILLVWVVGVFTYSILKFARVIN